MWNCPQTLEEAKSYRYNCWAGNPKGWAYVPERCAYEVHPNDRGALWYQCGRKNGHGPASLYCKQHASRVSGQGAR